MNCVYIFNIFKAQAISPPITDKDTRNFDNQQIILVFELCFSSLNTAVIYVYSFIMKGLSVACLRQTM